MALIAIGLHLDNVFTLLLLMRFNLSSTLLPTHSDFYGRKIEYTEAKKDPIATSSWIPGVDDGGQQGRPNPH